MMNIVNIDLKKKITALESLTESKQMPFDCPKLVLKKSIETLNKYINPF